MAVSEYVFRWLWHYEGFSGTVYDDATGHPPAWRGHPTTMIGRNLDSDPFTTEEARAWMEKKVDALTREVRRARGPVFDALDPIRQATIIELSYQIGARGICGFRNMWRALESQEWSRAANELLYRDPDAEPRVRTNIKPERRANHYADQLRTGKEHLL